MHIEKLTITNWDGDAILFNFANELRGGSDISETKESIENKFHSQN